MKKVRIPVRTRKVRAFTGVPRVDREPGDPCVPEGTGWPLHPSERCDLYHRVRFFPPDVQRWRGLLVNSASEDRTVFSAISPEESVEQIRERIDAGIAHLRELARILALIHGTPRLGNKQDPVDELVYIILARKTPEKAYTDTFDALKQRFERWEDLLEVSDPVIAKIINSGGLPGKKTKCLRGALGMLRDTFGSCTLEPLREWPDDRVEEFLCSLPEVSRKSAYCVMMYALGRKVFPVDAHVGRVLARVGPYRETGLSLEGLDHKQLQVVLAGLIPPDLRYSLHVNLLTHGRKVCRTPRPLCGSCEIRNLCRTFRASEARRVEALEAPVVVDLFCGAGGLSGGFRRAGFRVALALDNDPMSLRTYWLNHPELSDERILCRDVRELRPGELRRRLQKRRVDVLIGAPPCQGFSMAGHRSKSGRTGYKLVTDERNYLFEYFVKAAMELRPRLLVMENVPGMQSARQEKGSFLQMAAQLLEQAAGFKTAVWRLNASAFGVPQDRIRYFLVGTREGHLPVSPEGEYRDHLQEDYDLDALEPVKLGEAIFDLPPLAAGTGEALATWDPDTHTGDIRLRRYLAKFGLLRSSRLLYNHTVRYHNPRDLELYSILQPGEDSVDAIDVHGRSDLMRYRSDIFDDKYHRLRNDRPSKTIVSHLAKDGNGYIHPSQVRSISVREAARLQSFDDSHAFCGSPSDQWVQVGNAVPPVLAEAIARSFLRVLKR